MYEIVVRANSRSISRILVPNCLVNKEMELRYFLTQLAETDHERSPVCFWFKLMDGGLKAYFYANNRIECRTYSKKEIVEALLLETALFFHPADEILNLLEETVEFVH